MGTLRYPEDPVNAFRIFWPFYLDASLTIEVDRLPQGEDSVSFRDPGTKRFNGTYLQLFPFVAAVYHGT